MNKYTMCKANSCLLDPEKYASALKVFRNICIEWELSDLAVNHLGVTIEPKLSSLVTMSRVFNIYRSLHLLFADSDRANSWIYKENTALGSPANELLHSPEGLMKIQRYLTTQVELVALPITAADMHSVECLIEGVHVNLDDEDKDS